jgi:hypothetical protein
MGRKIAVVGMSPGGLVQLASLVKARNAFHEEYGDDEYTLIHDPDKVNNYMLSGTNPAYFDELVEVLNLPRRYLMKYANSTDSAGYKFVGWGAGKKNFFATYNHQLGAHFDIVALRARLLKEGAKAWGYGVSIVEQKIDGFAVEEDGCVVNGVKYDYVIDCTDKEPLYDPGSYGEPKFCLVDTALVVERPLPGDWDYTMEVAAKYGHITGMPYQDKQIWSYNFKRKDHDENEIFADMQTFFPDEDLKSYKWDKIEYNPSTSAYLIEYGGRYIRNGAAAVQADPLGGVHHELTQLFANFIDEYLYRSAEQDKVQVLEEIQMDFTDALNDSYMGYMAFLYHLGAKPKTAFWKNGKELAREFLKGPAFLHPAFFPGKEWLDEVLSEKWGQKEYMQVLDQNDEVEDAGGRISKMPLVVMSDYCLFFDLAKGLNAPWAKYLTGLETVHPPEKFGTIGYDYF